MKLYDVLLDAVPAYSQFSKEDGLGVGAKELWHTAANFRGEA